MLASCTTSLSLCKSFSKNSFFLLSTTYTVISVNFKCRSFLKADAKVCFFFDTMQDFGKEKCNIYVDFNTCLHNVRRFVGAHIVFITRERGG